MTTNQTIGGVPRGEPVYQVSDGVNGWSDVDLLRYTACCLDPEEYECRVLYAEQPAPVAFNGAAMNELRQIFDSNKGADGTLVISKRLASELLRK